VRGPPLECKVPCKRRSGGGSLTPRVSGRWRAPVASFVASLLRSYSSCDRRRRRVCHGVRRARRVQGLEARCAAPGASSTGALDAAVRGAGLSGYAPARACGRSGLTLATSRWRAAGWTSGAAWRHRLLTDTSPPRAGAAWDPRGTNERPDHLAQLPLAGPRCAAAVSARRRCRGGTSRWSTGGRLSCAAGGARCPGCGGPRAAQRAGRWPWLG
jgi:hypothetical protein